MDATILYTDRVLLALVANGGVATEVGDVEGAARGVHPVGGGQFAPDIHARMLVLLETGLIASGQSGRAMLTPAGASVLRGRPPSLPLTESRSDPLSTVDSCPRVTAFPDPLGANDCP